MSGSPMRAEEIYKQIIERRLYNFGKCKTPVHSVTAALSTGRKRNMFVRTNSNTYKIDDESKLDRETIDSVTADSDSCRSTSSEDVDESDPPTKQQRNDDTMNQMMQQPMELVLNLIAQFPTNPFMTPMEYYQRLNLISHLQRQHHMACR